MERGTARVAHDATRLRLGGCAGGRLLEWRSGFFDHHRAGPTLLGRSTQDISVTFEDDEFDESEYQRAVVESLGVEHHALHCGYDDIARVFPQVIWHAEKPLLRTAPAPLQLLSELVHASGFKVVLTGEGADELLGGYDIFKEAKVRRFHARQPDSEMRVALFERLYPYLPDMQSQSLAMRRAFFDQAGRSGEPVFFTPPPLGHDRSSEAVPDA